MAPVPKAKADPCCHRCTMTVPFSPCPAAQEAFRAGYPQFGPSLRTSEHRSWIATLRERCSSRNSGAAPSTWPLQNSLWYAGTHMFVKGATTHAVDSVRIMRGKAIRAIQKSSHSTALSSSRRPPSHPYQLHRPQTRILRSKCLRNNALPARTTSTHCSAAGAHHRRQRQPRALW